MSSPGLTPEWATIVLDSHQKNFADECAICFSEINHEFRIAQLADKAEEMDDVASAGTAESDDFAACARQSSFSPQTLLADDLAALTYSDLSRPQADAATPSCQGATHGVMISPANSCNSPHLDLMQPVEASMACQAGGDTVSIPASFGGSHLRTDASRRPDEVAEDIMAQASGQCTKEQLEFLYKTCRCNFMHSELVLSLPASLC